MARARILFSSLALLVLTSAPSAPLSSEGRQARVLVNEVLFFEASGNAGGQGSENKLRRHEWVELYNRHSEAIDLTGWVVSDREGRNGPGARALPPVFFPAGAYLLVHFDRGRDDLDFSDGCGEFYTGDRNRADLLDDQMDEVALYSETGVEDFVSWSDGQSPYLPGTAHDNAVAATIWSAGTFVNTGSLGEPGEKVRSVEPGTSMGRDQDSADTDTPQDWDTDGGANAADLTACRQNLDLLGFLSAPSPPAPRRAWTVMLYMDADHNLEKFGYLDLKEIESVGGPRDRVNVVAMVDGQTMIRQVVRDSQGELVAVPGTRGRAFRFQIGAEVDDRFVRMLSPDGQPFLGERDMGKPEELAGFIGWAKANFPADKYALILWSHGLGWKAFASDFTAENLQIDKNRPGQIYMGELSSALTGHSFELIGFDACFMGMIEVAHQIHPFGKYMVGSEEKIENAGFPYNRWLRGLRTNPGWNGEQLGRRIVEDFHDFYAFPPLDPNHTISLIDLSQVPELTRLTSRFGDDLRRGCDDFKLHDSPQDNVLTQIARESAGAERFVVREFMDLHDFADRIRRNPEIPECYKMVLPFLLPMAVRNGPVVLAEEHGGGNPQANGLSIYMPLLRTQLNPPDIDQPYDSALPSRKDERRSQRAMYAPNTDALPLQARDIETMAPLAAPRQWPLVPSPIFRFPEETLWDEFLMRYYHPVSDNHILYGIAPDGTRIFPVVNDPECGNPIDEITVPSGSRVFFSGVGSSDADPIGPPRHWMWDFDAAKNGCALCIAPYELAPGADAASADDDMNADRDADKTPLNDEKETDDRAPSKGFTEPGDYTVTLHPWDDNHRFPFHDTRPTARHVHPQTDDHISIVHVVPPTPTPTPTDTETPTSTPVPSPTRTATVPPPPTPTRTSTATPPTPQTPTRTATPTPTRTPTPVTSPPT